MASRALHALLATTLAATAATAAAARPLPMHRAPHAAPPGLAAPEAASPAAVTPLPYSGTKIDVLTYHYDNNRTGWNQAETDLTPASVASSQFVRLATLNVAGNVLAQPLLVSQYTMPDSTVHDLLIIATGRNQLYAYDANSFQRLWVRGLGLSQNSNDVGCGDVVPEYGISSTPVILRQSAGSATIYLVAAAEQPQGVFQSYLHAIDVGTGKDVVGAKLIAPSATLSDGSTVSFDPQNQWSRAGLAAASGSVYVSIGSHCDNNSGGISGWLLRYNAVNLFAQGAFNTVNTSGGTELASIWMTGFAPSIDAGGHVFVVTGNGDFTKGQKDWGESVLKISPRLVGVMTSFTPSSFDSLTNGDTDFGSGGVMLLPPVSGQTVPPLAVAMGKSSNLYLLNQNALGGERADDSGVLQEQYANGNGLWGGPAYYNGTNGPTVFAQTDSDVLRAYSVATTGTPSLTPGVSGTTSAGYGGSIPIVTSNGAGNASGVVWLVRRSNPMTLEAYGADSLGAPIATFNSGVWSNQSNQNSFVAPIAANGRVYAPAYNTVMVFGLKQ